jgi:hypothetical protein
LRSKKRVTDREETRKAGGHSHSITRERNLKKKDELSRAKNSHVQFYPYTCKRVSNCVVIRGQKLAKAARKIPHHLPLLRKKALL